jgi:hypothetical protein
MSLTKKYIDFILENVIESNIVVQLPEPREDGKLFWVKLGPSVYINVKLEVIDIYTRSVKFKVKFDKYELEQLVFIPIESSPMSIKGKLRNKVEKLVCKTFLDDNRQDDMRQMYDEKRKKMFSLNWDLLKKDIEVDEYGDDYKNYIKMPKELSDVVSDKEKFNGRNLSKEEFINKIKTDEEFAKRWGNTSNKIVE